MSILFHSTFPKIAFISLIAAFFIMVTTTTGLAQSTNQPVFNHAALCAHNLKKTADFYRNVIMLKEIKHPFKDTLHVWLKIGEGLALHIIQGECPATAHDIGVHLCFSVPSVEVFIRHLDEMNVGYSNWAGELKKIQLRTDGVKQIYLQDPDGFWVEINDARS